MQRGGAIGDLLFIVKRMRVQKLLIFSVITELISPLQVFEGTGSLVHRALQIRALKNLQVFDRVVKGHTSHPFPHFGVRSYQEVTLKS